MSELDIVIPVYNEGENILDVLNALRREVKTPFRVFIVYDFDEDNTLPVVKKITSTDSSEAKRGDMGFSAGGGSALGGEINLLKNRGHGAHEAIMTGFGAATAPAVLAFGADEANNACIVDKMYAKLKDGHDVVVASRLANGGEMSGGPRFKSFVVTAASFVLNKFAGLPATDATYAWRMFSRRLLDAVEIESTAGFTYAIELLVKCDRLGLGVAEVPAKWIMRKAGASRFNFRKWLPHYGRWFFYAMATTYMKKGPETVKLKSGRTLATLA